MKNPIKYTIAALTLGLALPGVRAQTTNTSPPPPAPSSEHEEHHKGPRGENLKHLTEKLSLTQDQQTKIKPIIEDEKKSLDALRDDTTVAKDAKRAKFTEIRKTHREQIRALLTPEQLKKYDGLKEERGPGGPGGTGAPDASKPPVE